MNGCHDRGRRTARITIVLPAEAVERVKEMAEESATPPSGLSLTITCGCADLA